VCQAKHGWEAHPKGDALDLSVKRKGDDQAHQGSKFQPIANGQGAERVDHWQKHPGTRPPQNDA